MSAKTGGVRPTAAVALAACAAAVASSCGVALPAELDGLGRFDCDAAAATRAGETRTAILFVRSHVSVGEDGLGSAFGAHFVQLVPRLVGAVNGYLRAHDAGIVLVPVGTDVEVNPGLYVVDTGGPGGTPAGASLAEVDGAAAEAPHEVHVHWSPRSTSRVTGYAGPPHRASGAPATNWIGYIEDPISGRPRTDDQRMRLLAHELGHYLGLAHNGVAGNLMRGDELPSGDELTEAQVREMHRVINADRRHLLVVSCGRGPQVDELLRQYPGRDLLRLAAGRPAPGG